MDPGMLSAVGVIATLVSVVFASAAFYVQSERRKQNLNLTSPPTAAPRPAPPQPLPEDDPHLRPLITPSSLQPIIQTQPQAPVQLRNTPVEKPPVQPQAAALFRRYTAAGSEIPVDEIGVPVEEEYVWE